MSNKVWYTFVSFGADPAPTGVFNSIKDCRKAVDRFKERHAALAGTYLSAARIAGPYNTRREAREADISTATRTVPA